MNSDFIVIGGGLFGCITALILDKKGFKTTLIEKEKTILSRSSTKNQLRIHKGYHYPRSLITSQSCQKFYQPFIEEFENCVNKNFKNYYLVPRKNSKINAFQFENFCKNSFIPFKKKFLDEINYKEIEAAYLTQEAVYDSDLLKQNIKKKLADSSLNCVEDCQINHVENQHFFTLHTNKGSFSSPAIVNSAYASINQIQSLFDLPPIKTKYELCEIAICELESKYKNYGFTLVDGPFISLIPYGNTGLHTLSSVRFTPHKTSKNNFPEFNCQKKHPKCSKYNLENCDTCELKPKTNFEFMNIQVKKYFPHLTIQYVSSVFSMKTLLTSSEISDSRPTHIEHTQINNKNFYSILSGKITNVLDLYHYPFGHEA